MAEGRMEMPQWLGIEVPPGSESRACTHEGFPGTWETRCVPPPNTGTERPEPNFPGLRRRGRSAAGATQSTRWGYGGATRKEHRRKRQRESERCVVPPKPGNRPD